MKAQKLGAFWGNRLRYIQSCGFRPGWTFDLLNLTRQLCNRTVLHPFGSPISGLNPNMDELYGKNYREHKGIVLLILQLPKSRSSLMDQLATSFERKPKIRPPEMVQRKLQPGHIIQYDVNVAVIAYKVPCLRASGFRV